MADEKPDTWMPMFWAKFFIDTDEFDDALTGAYAALLGHCWLRGGSLPDNDVTLANLSRSTPSRWKRHRAVLGHEPYFVVANGRWTQKRLTQEYERATHALQTKIANGKLGGRPRKTETKPAGYEKRTERKPAGIPNDNRPGKRNETELEVDLHPPTGGKTTREAPSAFAPPDWVPRKEWDDFDEMRRRKSGKAWTMRARELAVLELEKLVAQGEDAAGVLRQSVLRSWAGVFPVEQPKAGKRNGRLSPAGEQTAESVQRWIENEEANDATRGP